MRTSDELLAELKGLHPRLIDLSLGRIEALLAKLGHPERRLPPVIHVAGTNGKGSVTAFLKAMLEAAGLRVHVYTSPHLVRFHERIALAGAGGKARPIGESELVERLTAVQRINAGEPITFFEITTAAAFLAFAEIPADAVILEVGLGGRLDATNVVARPALSVITPISLDHADKLGATVAEIAREKAGILKTGAAAVVIDAAARGARRDQGEGARGGGAAVGMGRGLRGVRAERPAGVPERRAAAGPAAAGPHRPAPDRQRRHRCGRRRCGSSGWGSRSRRSSRGCGRCAGRRACSGSTTGRWRGCCGRARSCGSTAGTTRPAARPSPRPWRSWRSGRPRR